MHTLYLHFFKLCKGLLR